MSDIDLLAKKLAPHYSRFKVADRLLFTGHSHQAWPDVAREGQLAYFDQAALHVDAKWADAFEQVDVLRTYLRQWYEDPEGYYCLGPNTHSLLVAWLSSLKLKQKPTIITTDGEFHSMQRQLQRLREEGIEVINVPVEPIDNLVQRIADVSHTHTAAIMMSSVFFESSQINPHLSDVAQLARERRIPFLIDDYHGTNVAPLSISEAKLTDCFLITGGYKYLQWGEGNCFLRFPRDCELRPVVTGWYASFSTLEQLRDLSMTQYDEGDQRFASATYDASSQYRAAKVVEFFNSQGLNKQLLRQQSQAQIGLMRNLFDQAKLPQSFIQHAHQRGLQHNGGFMALRTPFALELQEKLKLRQ